MRIPTLKDIEEAQEKISSSVARTPLSHSRNCSKLTKTCVFLKQENHQMTGSFKIRGAMNKLLSLSEEERARGVIAASAGNHAQGVAYSATQTGVSSKVVMPLQTPLVKLSAAQSYGAEILLHGNIYDESCQRAQEVAREQGHTFIHPFEDFHIISGQGTLGLEVIQEIPDLSSIVVPIGGGGLISGMAIAIKASRPNCKVIGVVPENCPAMEFLFKQKTMAPFHPTIADGTSVKQPSVLIYNEFIKKYVDEVCSVSEGSIASAMLFLLERAKTVVEGSGALSLAALMEGNVSFGDKTCLILSGGNVDMNTISHIIRHGLTKMGRLARLSVVVPDRPGALSQLTRMIASESANILEVYHDRLNHHLHLHETTIEFLLETKSWDQIHKILKVFEGEGVKVRSSPVDISGNL